MMKTKWKNAIVIIAAIVVFIPFTYDFSYGDLGLREILPESCWLVGFPTLLFLAFLWANISVFSKVENRFARAVFVFGLSAILTTFVCMALTVSWGINAEERFTVTFEAVPNPMVKDTGTNAPNSHN